MTQAAPNHAVRVHGLSKRYRTGAMLDLGRAVGAWARGRRAQPRPEFWALRDVSFDIPAGQVVGIIGRNGAGKSTLLKLLAEITAPTAGFIELRGRLASLLEVGTGFHPELTGRENVFLNAAVLGMPRRRVCDVFDQIAAFADIDGFLDTPVKRYSSGMHVRLAFAVAAHLEPDILLVDEVLAVGDAAFQAKCLGRLDDVARTGRTVLFVSHQMSAVRRLCQRVLLIESGRLAFDGPADDAIDRYLGLAQSTSGRIIEHAQVNAPGVTIHNITVNGSTADRQPLAPTADRLDIAIEVDLPADCRLLVEARLFDSHHRALAFYSPRSTTTHFESFGPGRAVVRDCVALPKLNHGQYYLSVYLSPADLRHDSIVAVEGAVRLEAEGSPTAVGAAFRFDRGNGWMTLDRAA